jgi:signal peptidase II
MLQTDNNPKRNKPNFALEYLRYHLSFYKRFWCVFGGVFVLDQLTKLATLQWLPKTEFFNPETGEMEPFTPIIPGFFHLIHVHNEGAAFSILRGYRWPLVLLAGIALAGIFRFRRHLELQRTSRQWIFGLLAGGIFGNVLDRMLHGKVIDFLDLNLPIYGHWPAFNIADCGICVGAIVYLAASLREDRKSPPPNRVKPDTGEASAPRRPPPAQP